jgi:hypothetical protein
MISLGTSTSRCFLQRRSHNLFGSIVTLSSTSTKCSKRSSNNLPPEVSSKVSSPDKWNYSSVSFNEVPSVEHVNYKHVNANDLEQETIPPHGVKMLARDFIEDSLYNPHYGYFPKQATIFDTQNISFNFLALRDSVEFQEEIGRKYAAYGPDRHDSPGRQLWHTPTELFKVWY